MAERRAEPGHGNRTDSTALPGRLRHAVYLVQTYGYAAIFPSPVIEGETPVLMGDSRPTGTISIRLGPPRGVPRRELPRGPGLVSRRAEVRRPARSASWPSWRASDREGEAVPRRASGAYILGFRFLYGLRTISPIVVGMTRVSWTNNVLLDAIGSAMLVRLLQRSRLCLRQRGERRSAGPSATS